MLRNDKTREKGNIKKKHSSPRSYVLQLRMENVGGTAEILEHHGEQEKYVLDGILTLTYLI